MFKRKEKDSRRIIEFLNKERVCDLSMIFEGEPHITPMIYVYDEENDAMFFHSSPDGTKIRALRADGRVAFSVMRHTANHVIDTDGKPCGYGIVYESVVGYGRMTVIDALDEKIAAYDMMSAKFAPHKPESRTKTQCKKGESPAGFEYRENELNSSLILRLDIKVKSGKAWDGINPVCYF